jgi:hypothetical protein
VVSDLILTGRMFDRNGTYKSVVYLDERMKWTQLGAPIEEGVVLRTVFDGKDIYSGGYFRVGNITALGRITNFQKYTPQNWEMVDHRWVFGDNSVVTSIVVLDNLLIFGGSFQLWMIGDDDNIINNFAVWDLQNEDFLRNVSGLDQGELHFQKLRPCVEVFGDRL